MTTFVRLEDVKNVDNGTQICVYGYIRRVQDIFPEDNVYFTIPKLVIHWILLYFYMPEEFKVFNPKKYVTSDNGKRLTRLKNSGVATCYGAVKITSLKETIHEWKFKIIKRTRYIAIGIDETKYAMMKKGHFQNRLGIEKTRGYAVWEDGIKSNMQNERTSKEEKIKFNGDDTVRMILDLKQRTLSYSINHEEIVIAFDNITVEQDLEYCMAIVINNETDCVDLLHYKER